MTYHKALAYHRSNTVNFRPATCASDPCVNYSYFLKLKLTN